jgi:Putative DNA-binding domain
MPPLDQLQGDFRDYLLTGGRSLSRHVAAPPGTDAEARMAVYFNAFRSRLVEALQETYEKTWAYLGDQYFAEACERTIENRPPSSWTLRDYGAHLIDDLETHWREAPEVAELARLDWAIRHCFDGPDAQPLKPQDLAGLAGDRWVDMRIAFHPTLACLPVRWNVAAIWSAIDADHPPPAAARLGEPATVRLWRRGLQPHYRTIDPIEAQGLALLRGGGRFGELCELATGTFGAGDGTLKAGGLLRAWLDDGLIIACVSDDVEDNRAPQV